MGAGSSTDNPTAELLPEEYFQLSRKFTTLCSAELAYLYERYKTLDFMHTKQGEESTALDGLESEAEEEETDEKEKDGKKGKEGDNAEEMKASKKLKEAAHIIIVEQRRIIKDNTLVHLLHKDWLFAEIFTQMGFEPKCSFEQYLTILMKWTKSSLDQKVAILFDVMDQKNYGCLTVLEVCSFLHRLEKHEYATGDKVVIKEGVERGTIRFIGQVKGLKGQQIGLELNEPNGDFDGIFKGIEYFKCEPRHGFFVTAKQIELASHYDSAFQWIQYIAKRTYKGRKKIIRPSTADTTVTTASVDTIATVAEDATDEASEVAEDAAVFSKKLKIPVDMLATRKQFIQAMSRTQPWLSELLEAPLWPRTELRLPIVIEANKSKVVQTKNEPKVSIQNPNTMQNKPVETSTTGVTIDPAAKQSEHHHKHKHKKNQEILPENKGEQL